MEQLIEQIVAIDIDAPGVNLITLEQQLEIAATRWVANGIKQHSPEWHAARSEGSGGSTVAAYMDVYPYKTMRDIALERLGIVPFEGSVHTRWGTLLEDVLKGYVELAMNISIVADSAFVRGPRRSYYSPDGVGIVDIAPETIDIFGEPVVSGRQIALFEFKCPFVRMPDGRPPGYYVPQVLMGMDLLVLPTVGVFIEAVFRRCTLAQLGRGPKFDATFNVRVAKGVAKRDEALKRYGGRDIASYGIIGIYELHQSDAVPTIGTLRDLGCVSGEEIGTIFEGLETHKNAAWYAPARIWPTMAEVESDMAAFVAFCCARGVAAVGVYPWKLLDTHTHYINKEPGFLSDTLLNRMDEMVDFVRSVAELSREEQMLVIDKKWPEPPPAWKRPYGSDYYRWREEMNGLCEGGALFDD